MSMNLVEILLLANLDVVLHRGFALVRDAALGAPIVVTRRCLEIRQIDRLDFDDDELRLIRRLFIFYFFTFQRLKSLLVFKAFPFSELHL